MPGTLFENTQVKNSNIINSNPGKVKRPLPPTPTVAKTTSQLSAKSIMTPQAAFFTPALQKLAVVEKKKEIDLNKILMNFKIDPADYPEFLEAMYTGEVDLMEEDKNGNCFHDQAIWGNAAFFDFVLNDEVLRKKVNINAVSLINHSTPLSKAIHNDHFALALKLIREYGADPHQLVNDSLHEIYDNTASMLRLAFSLYFNVNYNGGTQDSVTYPGYDDKQKKLLFELCKELLSRGLSFFEVPGSHCPPAFQIGIRREVIGYNYDYEKYIKDHKLTLDQYWIIKNMLLLEKTSSDMFKLFYQETQKAASTNANAKNIVHIWTWFELNGRPKEEYINIHSPASSQMQRN